MADALGYFQTAGWARAAGQYDKAIGRSPVLLGCRDPDGSGFSLPLSVGREGSCKVARILGEQLAEYTDIVGGSVTPEGLHAAFALLRRRYGVDLVSLRRVPKGSKLDTVLDRIGAVAETPQQGPWVPLGPDGPLPNRNGGRMTGYRQACRHRRRLQRARNYRFEVFRAEEVSKEIVRLALNWKRQWILDRGLVSRVGTEVFDEATSALLTSSTVGARIGVLWSDGEPAAVESGFLWRDRFFSSLRAYHPDHKEDRVGTVALGEMIEWSARQRLAVFDLGPPADAYKLEWTGLAIAVSNRLVPLSLLGRSGQLLEGTLKPLARSLVGQLPPPLRKRMLRLSRYTH